MAGNTIQLPGSHCLKQAAVTATPGAAPSLSDE